MPVIPFSSASRAAGAADDITERVEAEEARRYREAADAKLKELMNTPVKRFDPNGGTPMIDIPEPVTGGWRVRTNGDPQVNADALPGGAFNRSVEPELDDPVRDETGFGPVGEWTEDLSRPVAPEGDTGFVGMGSGGPGGEGGLSDQTISDIRDRLRIRKEGESTRDLRARMLNAPNPDQAAIDADLAERRGVNRLEVEQNRDTFVAVDRAQAIDELRKTAPKLRAWLDYNPANLEVAHDDVESLGWWEQTAAFFSPGNLSIDKVGQALQSGFVDKIPEQLYGLDQMLGDANASIYKALPDWFPGKFGLVNEQVQRSLMADMKRQEMAAQGKANAPVGETWLERGIYGAAQSAPSTLVSLAITAVTKSPVLGSGSMGATTAGGAYGEARDQGKSLGDAFRYALTQGGIETATEFIPLKFLVDDLAKDSSFAKTFFRQAAAEGITEQAATFLQDASTFIELNPDKTLGEFLAERPNAALETLVASTIMSGVTTTVAQGMQAAGDQIDRNAKQKRAEELAKFIDKAVDNGANSKLLKRGTVGADKYREAVAASTDAKFRIDSDAITALAQEEGVTVEQIAQAFRIDPDEMVTAIDTGSDVLVPVGNYVAAIQTAKKEIGLDGGAIHTALGPNMRVGENDLTAREQASATAAIAEEQAARERVRAEAAKPLTLETLPQQLLMLARDARGGTVSKSGISGSEREMLEEAGYKPDEEGNYDLNDLVAEADRRRAAGTLNLSMSQYDNSHITDWETKRKGRAEETVYADAADRVRNTIREAVTATGLFNADAANTQAELVGSIVTTLAERTGQDPEALWKEQGFDIVASLKGEDTDPDGLAQSMSRQPVPIGDVELEFASKELSPQEFEAWKGARDGLSNEQIAERMNAVEPDAVVSSDDVKRWLFRSRERGYDSQKPHYNDRGTDPKTLRLIELRARGVKNPQIAAALYPEVDTQTAVNRVKALASKNKAKIEERRVALEGARSLAQTEQLDQEKRGTFTPREDRNVIRLFESANLSTLAHEGAHWYLDTLWRMSTAARGAEATTNPEMQRAQQLIKAVDGGGVPSNPILVNKIARALGLEVSADAAIQDTIERIRAEVAKAPAPAATSAHPFVLEQLAAVLEWHGKSPNWDAMFNPDGSFTKEGVDLQEAFAESFELYLREGKAPTTALRSVFASFKQWLLSLYKSISGTFFQRDPKTGAYTMRANLDRANLNDEIRQVFDRMLATDEAIKAVHTGLARDGEAMAKAILDKQDPDGKWKPERREKFMERMRERYAAARERAEAALMARLMDEFQRTKQAAWNDEQRQVRREVQSEVDERPEQRLFAWLAGKGWRQTRADLADEAADEADAMRALAQEIRAYHGSRYSFDRFEISDQTIGTGEGTQSRGYGLYFADRQGLAEFYQNLDRVKSPEDFAGQVLAENGGNVGAARAYLKGEIRTLENTRTLRDFAKSYKDALKALDRGKATPADKLQRYLYEVNLTLTPGEDVLDLDIAIADQTPAVREKFAEAWTSLKGDEPLNMQATGFDLIQSDGRSKEMSEAMLAAGLKGVQFFDAASRARGDGSRNYVMFSADDIRIVAKNGEPVAEMTEPAGVLSMEDGAGSLAQTVGEPRQLDAMGFYSAAQEAAQRVPDGIWQMGWQAARNSLAKGRDGVVPRKTEIEYLGLDAMFGDTKLKGAALKDAVLEHIAAKRLSLVENFARVDYNAKAPAKAVMLDEIDDDTLSSMIGLHTPSSGQLLATELDGATEFQTGLFMRANGERTQYDVPKYDLFRVLDGGKREVLGNGVPGDLAGIAARIIVNENRNLVMRKISAETMQEHWRESIGVKGDRDLVRGPGDIRLPGEDVPLFEAVIGLPEGVPGADYRAPVSHVGGKAKGTLVTAHGEERIDDKGQRTVFVGQVQSDMAQQAREENGSKEAERMNEPVIKASGINDRKAALDYLFSLSMGYSRERWDAEVGAAFEFVPDDRVVDQARDKWATKNNMDYARRVGNGPNLDAPLLSTSEWTNVAVRSMLYRAAREGFQSISFPTAETSEIIQGNDSAAQHYETNVKGALEKLAKQLGGEVRKGGVGYAAELRDWSQVDPDTAHSLLNEVWSKLPDGLRQTLLANLKSVRRDSDDDQFYVSNGKDIRDADAAGFGRETWNYELRAAKSNPLIAAYSLWVQGAVIWDSPGAFEKMLEVAGGGGEAVAAAFEKAKTLQAEAYILDITPAMRAKIMSEGFPLFQTGDDKGRATPPPNLPPMRLNLQAVKEQYGEQALAEIPPDVAAYSAEANDVEAYVQIARDVRKTLNETPPKSLWKFLSTPRNIGQGEGRISYRGIRDTDGELLKIIGEKKAARGLIADPTKDNKRSRSYDMQQAIEAAWEAGYFDGEDLPTPAEFLDTLRADIDGQAPRYRRDDIPTVSTIAGAERWKDWFEQNDLDITSDVATLRAKLATVLTGQGTSAIGPDEAAEVFNGVMGSNAFPTGFDLLKALKQGPLRDKLIRDLTEQRMIERNGDVFRDGTIMAEAEAYARNEVQHRQFEIELEALAEAAGKGTAGALAKQTAIENLRSKQVREVLNYTQWLTLERRWAEKAIRAAAKGDTAQAAEFARYRLINSYMYSEGKKLAEKIEKTRKHLLDYGKKAKQVRLFAAGKEYADQMNGLLDDYQFRNESKKGENKRATRAVWLQAQMAGLDPFAAYADPTKSPQEQAMAAAEAIERSAVLGRLAEGVDARNYKSITVEELLAVRDEADLIFKLATLKDRLLKVGERRRMSLLAGDIVASVSANQPKVLPPEPLESNLRGEKIKRAISGFMVSHRTFQALARQFDGGQDGGVFWRLIVRPLNDAFARKTVLMKQVGKDVEKLFSPFSSAELGRFMRDRQTITLSAADGSSTRVTLTTQGRLAVAMNAGNEKNLARLMDSNGWDRLQVQAIIDTLSKREMDFVQATWDYLETWFAEANRVHEAVHGVPMDKQEPLQLATRHGIYAGGYFPIAFDPNRSSKSGQRKLEADAQATGAGRVGVRNEPGFAKKRVSGKVTLPLNLDPFAVILRHLDQVTTSIATEEVLFDVGRLIKLPEVENVIVERHGRVKYDEIIEAIKAAKFGLPVAQGAVEKILNHVRNGSTVAKLGWSVSTAMLQPSGISNSIVRIGFPWMMRGYGRMLGTAAQREGWAKWAMERSEFMRNRRESQSPEQANLLATLKGNKPLVMIQRSAFQLMAQVQFFSVDLATWYGAFDKATAGGADEALAVSMADQAVLDAQGGGEAFQTAGIQRGSVGVRLLTNLMSYMLTTYQLSVQSVATKDPNLLKKIARISADMVLLWSVPVAATMAIRYAIAAAIGGGDDDDEEYWSLENISREQASFLMSPFFGLSQVAGAVKMDPYEYRGPAGLDMLVQSYKAMDAASHGDTDQLLRPLNQMVGMAFHLPANQIDKTVRGSMALWNGETDSPLAIFFGPPPAN